MWEVILLFVLLSPGVLLTLPPVGNKVWMSGKMSVLSVCVHAVIFVLAMRFLNVNEGFQRRPPAAQRAAAAAALQCGAGYRRGLTGCVICPAGTYSNPGAMVCTPCPVNTYTDEPGFGYCMGCNGGTSGPGDRMKTPKPGAPVFYTNGPGSTECLRRN